MHHWPIRTLVGRSNSICRSSIMCVVVCFACTSGCQRYNDISANFNDYKQRDNLNALVDSMVFSNGEFWDYDANGRRVFPSDISGLVSRTSKVKDGVWIIRGRYVYRSVYEDGRRIENDSKNQSTCVIIDTVPNQNGRYFAVTAGLGIRELDASSPQVRSLLSQRRKETDE